MSVSRVIFSSVLIASMLSSSAEANPISTPFDYAFEIAIFNFPINGFLLLAVYFALVKRGANAMYFGTRSFVIVILCSTTIISLTGGLVDSVAYMTLSFPVHLVATCLIGVIAGVVVHRYLRLDFEASWVVAIVFFFVNLISWTLLASDAIVMIAWEYCAALWILSLAFMATLLIVAKEHQGGIAAKRYSALSDPPPTSRLPGTASSYPVKVTPWTPTSAVASNIVREIVLVSVFCFVMFYLAYFLWYL